MMTRQPTSTEETVRLLTAAYEVAQGHVDVDGFTSPWLGLSSAIADAAAEIGGDGQLSAAPTDDLTDRACSQLVREAGQHLAAQPDADPIVLQLTTAQLAELSTRAWSLENRR